MGILDILQPKASTPVVNSILPDVAKQEILSGRLPVLNTNKIFLKAKEQCHYIEKAVYEKKIIHKSYKRKNTGYSVPGLFKGTRVHMGGSNTDVVENAEYQLINGLLFITNKRIIFVGKSEGFDKTISSLIAITPYANCIDLQFSKENLKIFLPDGNIANAVFQQLR